MKVFLSPYWRSSDRLLIRVKGLVMHALDVHRHRDRLSGNFRRVFLANARPSQTAERLTHLALTISLTAFGLAWYGQCVAASPPDAGALLNELGRDRAPQLPQRSAPQQQAPVIEQSVAESPKLTVKQFRFLGNTLFSGDQLSQATHKYLGHPISIDQLRQAVADVAATYRNAGWVVKAYLPKQDVTEGVVTIRIVEATYSGARLEGEAPSRVRQARLLGYFSAEQQPGDYLSTKKLDRALLLADDLAGVAVTGALHPGKELGTTELLVHATDEPGYTGQLQIDNSGARATGGTRGIASLQLNSPSGRGDRIDANLIHSEGSDYLWLNYALPVGNNGWQFNIDGAYLNYRLTAPDFAALHGKGRSASVGLGLTYPIIRSRLRNLYLDLGFDHNSFHNEANATTQSDYRVNTLNVGLTGNAFDSFGGGGASYMALNGVAGQLDQKTLDLGENPSQDGAFKKLTYSFSRQQVLTDRLTLYAALKGQLSDDNLDSSQRFYLGGPNGVRAYPVNEASGSRGRLANLELRWNLPQNLTVSGFYDWGHVGNTDDAPSYDLKGYGVGVTWSAPRDFTFKAVLARRDGSNPNQTATGNDQDGSLKRNRIWATLSYRF